MTVSSLKGQKRRCFDSSFIWVIEFRDVFRNLDFFPWTEEGGLWRYFKKILASFISES